MSTITEIIARLQMSMSQSEISRETGIPQPKLSRWGSGAAAAGADDALKLLALDQKIAAKKKAELQAAMDQAGRDGVIKDRRVALKPRRADDVARDAELEAFKAAGQGA